MRSVFVVGGLVALTMLAGSGVAQETAPTGHTAKLEFHGLREEVNMKTDFDVRLSDWPEVPFKVQEVQVNGVALDTFLVRNKGFFSGDREVTGGVPFSVSGVSGWKPGQEYNVTILGKGASGIEIKLEATATAPEALAAIKGLSFGRPVADKPYHHITMTLAKEAVTPGKVVSVDVDGTCVNRKFCHQVRFFNVGIEEQNAASKGIEGESFEGIIDGARDFMVIAPCTWTNGSAHTMRLVVQSDSGEEQTYERQGDAPASGGYWNADWPYFASVVLQETVGMAREGEPVHLSLGLFSDEMTDPATEIRVVAYDPMRPSAGPDGYAIAPCQVTDVAEWADKALLAAEERDAETGELVHRYDPTTTVDLVFLADVLPYEEKVFQILYGNPNAEPLAFNTDLKVEQGADIYAETISTNQYKITTAEKSGAVETLTVMGKGDPVLLEHRLETNGAVHWNPGCYSPPLPWVHVSDWEQPDLERITGPLMHRTSRYAPLPHMTDVAAHVAYTFYAGQPYVLMSSLMEVQEEQFVKALRNGEIVFNHAVLDEFVWKDALGATQSVMVADTNKHPLHGLEFPADTPWWALISRKHGVGFASIQLAYENTNMFGAPDSEAQPYFYLQNGPWVYVSRPIVYPFGGQNLTRMMRVRKGALCLEENAWLLFRLADGENPFEQVEDTAKRLTHPLHVREYMPIDDRTPDKWVMPILTMPFDEGVAGAVSAHKPVETGEE